MPAFYYENLITKTFLVKESFYENDFFSLWRASSKSIREIY